MEQLAFEDMKYGLIAIDRREAEKDPDGDSTILHFCGYGKKPNQWDVNVFFHELKNTPEFGLADIMEFIEVYEAPEEIVAQYREDLINGTITDAKS